MADRASSILVVEDEKNLGLTLVERLQREGFSVFHAETVEEAKAFVRSRNFDLCLLDVGLPDGSGFEVALFLKQERPATAIIFLTAQGSPESRIRGLELGAEDYVVKPFHLKELLLRVQNGLKRARYLTSAAEEPQNDVAVGKARIDFQRFLARIGDQEHVLTHKECALLKLLVEKRGKVVSRDEILNRVWSEDEYPTPRTVDNFIMRLRRLVEPDVDNPEVIKSIRGVGYQLS